MKIVMIAALAAAQLSLAAGPARASDLPRQDTATSQAGGEEAAADRAGLDLASMERTDLGDGQASAPDSSGPAAVPEDRPRKKGKSTGDKVLTGAAVILGLGALAVGGLLVAIAVN